MTQTHILGGTLTALPDGIRGTRLQLAYTDAAGAAATTMLPLCKEQQAYAGLKGGEQVRVEVRLVSDQLRPQDIVAGGIEVLERA